MKLPVFFAALALAFATVAVAFLALAETYSSQTCTVRDSATLDCVMSSTTLMDENGTWVLALLALPLLITAAALFAAYRRLRPLKWTLACLALAGSVISAASLGIFFMPSALLLLAAAIADRRADPDPVPA